MKSQRLVGLLAGTIVVASVLAQVAPTCCKYLYSWPTSGNPGPLCYELQSQTCETGTTTPGIGDPLARQRSGIRPAQCKTFFALPPGSFYVRSDCAFGPPVPGAQLVGVLPDGQCCWIVGGSEPVIETLPYWVLKCDGPCGGSPG